jgi:hypothetical protein
MNTQLVNGVRGPSGVINLDGILVILKIIWPPEISNRKRFFSTPLLPIKPKAQLPMVQPGRFRGFLMDALCKGALQIFFLGGAGLLHRLSAD